MCFRTIIIAIAVSSNRRAELKVYTDFGNVLHMCKRCYEIYEPEDRLKTEEVMNTANET
jgi:hypothetical protein